MSTSSLEVTFQDALNTQDWDSVVAMIESHWSALTQTNQALLVRAVNSLPDDVLAENPRLMAAKTYVNYLPINGDARPIRFQHAVAAPTGELLDVLADLTSRSVSARFRGDPIQAVAFVRQAHTTIAEVSDDAIAEIRPVLPDIRLQWAITLEMAGELVDANRAYERTFDEALTFGNQRIAVKAAGSLAFNFALAGNRVVAEQWLSRQPIAGSQSDDDDAAVSPDTVTTTGELARALLAVNDLRFDDARAALHAAPPADVDRETWALRLYVESVLARAEGQARRQLVGAGSMLSTQPERVRTTGLNGWLVTMATAELQLALGDITAANRTIAQAADFDVVAAADPSRLLRAWAALRRGDPRAALVLAAPGLSLPLTSPRITAELLVIIAAAGLALGQTEDARSHFAEAVDIIVSEKLGIVLLRLTAEERDVLVAGHRDALGDNVVRELEFLESAATAPPIVQLSERERVVLRHLVQGQSLPAIARAEHLSQNTIKSQVRSIYRKLGVNDRDGAARAVAATPHLLT